MREPISWFESRFWFKRNGWIHKEGARLHENIEDGEVCTFFGKGLRLNHITGWHGYRYVYKN